MPPAHRNLARTAIASSDTQLTSVTGGRMDSTPFSVALANALRAVSASMLVHALQSSQHPSKPSQMRIVKLAFGSCGFKLAGDIVRRQNHVFTSSCAAKVCGRNVVKWKSETVRWHTTIRDAQVVVARIVEQDTEGDPKRGGCQIKDGVAVDRLISLHDPEMRHGRKSATQRIDGYKRYIGSDLDAAIVLGVAVQAANIGEHHGADALRPEVEEHGEIAEVHIDRAFLASQLVADLDARGDPVVAKPYPAQGKPGYTKLDFTIDLDAQQVTYWDDRSGRGPRWRAAEAAMVEGQHT